MLTKSPDCLSSIFSSKSPFVLYFFITHAGFPEKPTSRTKISWPFPKPAKPTCIWLSSPPINPSWPNSLMNFPSPEKIIIPFSSDEICSEVSSFQVSSNAMLPSSRAITAYGLSAFPLPFPSSPIFATSFPSLPYFVIHLSWSSVKMLPCPSTAIETGSSCFSSSILLEVSPVWMFI